ncbi:hypothetical protein [Paraflavitalea speifideaquila]|uniref:hypothetical protein n=1 Tax=Paraflavitalea speifideaquila TaxID=3076558 RepID=UPI0028ECF460|nr:hypothetical protein [Paraflavitalea speifideiaquila]
MPASIDKQNPRFPLFIKPYNGSLSADTYIIHQQADLLPHHLANDNFLFMEYLAKQDYDEYTVDMYYNKAGLVKCIVPEKDYSYARARSIKASPAKTAYCYTSGKR